MPLFLNSDSGDNSFEKYFQVENSLTIILIGPIECLFTQADIVGVHLIASIDGHE